MKSLTQEEVLDKINKSESFKGLEIVDLNFDNFTFDKTVDFRGSNVYRGS